MKSIRFTSIVAIGALGLSLALAPFLRADEIILNSGKTLHGRITSETESVYKIKVGRKMLLSVSKDDVADVIRDAPPPAPVAEAVHHAPPVEPVPETAANPEATPETSAETATDPETEAPLPADAIRRQLKAGAAIVNITIAQKTYDVTGNTLDEVIATITDPKNGIGFPGRTKKRASRTDWRVRWYGKPNANGTAWEELVIGSTLTTTQPVWIYRGEMPVIQANRWKVFSKQRADVEARHVAIIEETLETFALSASNLVAGNEAELRAQTSQLLSEIRGRGDNRRKGLNRRLEEPRPSYLARRKKLK